MTYEGMSLFFFWNVTHIVPFIQNLFVEKKSKRELGNTSDEKLTSGCEIRRQIWPI